MTSLFSKRQNLRVLQTQSTCKRQIGYSSNDGMCRYNDRKHCGKRKEENAGNQHFHPFESMFSTVFNLRIVQNKIRVSRAFLIFFFKILKC